MAAGGREVRDIVLVGGGHRHAVALRQFALKPLPGARLTLICTDADTPYSGMLPGYIAGYYRFDEVHIDLRRLAASAGAPFMHDEAVGIETHPPLQRTLAGAARTRAPPGRQQGWWMLIEEP